MTNIEVQDMNGGIQSDDRNFDTKSIHGKEQSETEQDYLAVLKRLGIKFSRTASLKESYENIVAAAVAIMGSQYATLQLLYPAPGSPGKLHIEACHGFTPEAERYWEWIYHNTGSSCGEVLRTRRRGIVPDYRTCDFMQHAPTLPVFIEGGILAAQSTPLYSSAGKLLGMISTHWAYPYTPSQNQLNMLDILAHQSTDLIEHAPTIEA